MTLPVTVLGGYLGAGKTTLVNHLLRQAGGRRIGVLVNEFGALAIDADLIGGAEGNLIALSGGCICCSYGDDLLAALGDMARRADSLDHVLIEASGVALPGAIARSVTLIGTLALDAIVVLADAETVRRQASDRYMADTITRQLADADLVILNKADLVAVGELAEVQGWLSGPTRGVRIVTARHAAVAPAIVLGLSSRFDPNTERAPHHQAGLDSAEVELGEAVDAGRLAELLADPALGLVRAKGFVRDRDGGWRTVQVVGRRASVTPAPAGVGPPARLVCIAAGRDIDRSRIMRAIATASAAA